MTWTPETNRIPCYLLTDEEYQAVEAAKHGFEYRCGVGHQWTDPGDITPSRTSSVVFRAKTAPPPHPEYLRALKDVEDALPAGPVMPTDSAWSASESARYALLRRISTEIGRLRRGE